MWEEYVGVIEEIDEEMSGTIVRTSAEIRTGWIGGKKSGNFIANLILSTIAVEGEGRQSQQSYNNDLHAWGMITFITPSRYHHQQTPNGGAAFANGIISFVLSEIQAFIMIKPKNTV